MKHNIILNWECCMTVSLLQLQRMILLYEFLKETSIYSAFEREEVIAIILRNPFNGLHSSPLFHQLFCNKECFLDFPELTQCPVFFLLSQNVYPKIEVLIPKDIPISSGESSNQISVYSFCTFFPCFEALGLTGD